MEHRVLEKILWTTLRLNSQSSKEKNTDVHVLEKYLTPLAFREMKIKPALGFHLTQVRMASIKKIKSLRYQGCGGRNGEYLITAGGRVGSYRHRRAQYKDCSKN